MDNDKKVLWMIWKNPNKNQRRRYKIGELSLESNKYSFRYTDPEISDAMKSGFLPFPGFEDLNKEYVSDVLFTNINCRLPNKNRDDYKDIMLRYNIGINDNAFEVLAKTKGRQITDTIEFVEPFNKNSFDFDVAGIQYYDINTIKKYLRINDRVKLALDEHNKYDKYAVKVLFTLSNKDYILGYVPRFYSKDVSKLLQNDNGYTAIITNYNINKEFDDYNSVVIKGSFN